MTTAEHLDQSYEVFVRGDLKPAVLAFCAGSLAHRTTSGVFQLRVGDGQGIDDLVAMLQTTGLMILSVRQVTNPDLVRPSERIASELIPRG